MHSTIVPLQIRFFLDTHLLAPCSWPLIQFMVIAHHRQKMEYFQKQYHFYLSKLFLTPEKWIFGQLVSSNGIFVKKKFTCFQPFLTNIFLWILGINLRIILTVWIPIVVILSREILAFIQIAAFYTHRQSLSSINNQLNCFSEY